MVLWYLLEMKLNPVGDRQSGMSKRFFRCDTYKCLSFGHKSIQFLETIVEQGQPFIAASIRQDFIIQPKGINGVNNDQES